MNIVKNVYQKRVLILALFAGEIMLKNGAEISRVEDTIVRICRACKIDYVECFATTTGIILSLDVDNIDSDMHTFIKRISYTTINLSKISAINRFSRVFTSTDLSIEDGFEQLKEINAIKDYPFGYRLIASLIIGACMVAPYGGSLRDMLCSAIAACVAFCSSSAIDLLKFPPFIRIFLGSSLAALTGFLLVKIGLGISVTPILLGAVTIFMPGVAITNAARDLLSGDMLAGLSRSAQAVISAVAIAGGIGITMKIWIMSFGNFPSWKFVSYSAPLFILFGIIATFGFCVMFRAPIKQFITISFIGGLGMFVNIGGTMLGNSAFLTCFLGSCIIAIFAEIAAKFRKDATSLFILPGIIPFVPGNILYQAMECVLEGNFNKAASYGTDALIISGSIALALILVAAVTRLCKEMIRRIRVIIQKKESAD